MSDRPPRTRQDESYTLYFCLRGADGPDRAALRLADDGTSVLALHHANGAVKIGVGVSADGTSNAFMSDAQGTIRYAVRLDASGTPVTTLFDATGVERAVLKLQLDGTAHFTLRDAAGKVRVGQMEASDGSGTVLVAGLEGRGAGTLSSGPNGASLQLADEERVLRASLSARQDGPSLAIYDEGPRVRLGVTAEGGAELLLFDAQGKSRLGLEMRLDGVGAMDITNQDGKILALRAREWARDARLIS